MPVSLSALTLDVYQLTTLFAHAANGKLTNDPLSMSFFFRKLPKQRNYVVSCGLRSIIEHCQSLSFSAEELHFLRTHPVLEPVFNTPLGDRISAELSSLNGFEGDIDALPEGTLAFAGPALREDGTPFLIGGSPISAYTPLLQVQTKLSLCKLIETPWLSRLNYLSMVASKAARVVSAASCDGIPRPVIEFGQRRTHPLAAIDAAYASYVGGCVATSNVAASFRHGIPSVGTMDHFAIQACERLQTPVSETERAFFRRFCELFPGNATLLVDTYDTWRGIEHAVQGSDGKLSGIRLDSGVTPDSVRRARKLLDELGVPHAKLFLSDGLDEYRVRELAAAGGDGFGVGENITCSPDSATGIGAVGKLVKNADGKLTMKLSRGSGKATLPGLLQVYRFSDHDFLMLQDEEAPKGGIPLLKPLWRGKKLVAPLSTPLETQKYVRSQIATLPPLLQGLELAAVGKQEGAWSIRLSNRLAHVVEELASAV
jgi:nicotinate phosphoribosyltransferase